MKLEAIDDPSDELRESVYVHLREYNQRMNATAWAARDLPENAAKAVNIFASDEDGRVVGGLFGTTEFSWLKIDIMAVPEALRKTGIGTELLDEAERIAKTRGCKYAFTDTMEHQAPNFYRKAGYAVVGEIPDWDSHGHTKYFLRKEL